MKITISNWCFSPKILTSLLALIFFYMFVSLGLWQLDRAEQKSTIYAEFESRQAAEAINFNQDKYHQLGKEELIWRRIKVSGKFLERYQFLLDNQVFDTKAGYFVYTPFRLDQSELVILVNRGWLLANANRSVLPDLMASENIVNINAVVKEVPRTGLLLEENSPEHISDTVYRVQRINIEELEELTNLKLLPYIVRLEPESGHGYSRKWRLPGSDENMHIGYAFQWFAFATALFVIYLVLNIKRIQDTTS
jgi:surfeit locus 1 family protein